MDAPIPLCNSADLANGGEAVSFDVVFGGQTCRAFAIRFEGRAQAYLNRCAHVAMEMDWQPDRFFDDSGRWLLCSTHGAVYQPDTGACAGRALPRRSGEDHPDRARRGGPLAYCPQPPTS
jgi:nitrite reductase/ring-hydroxylating ferredoxin subunit